MTPKTLLNRLMIKARSLSRAPRVYAKYIETYRRSPDFSLENFDKGFAPQASLKIRPDYLRRISNAYLKAKEAQKNAPVEFQVGNEWLPIYQRQFRASMKALLEGDLDAMDAMYQNFLRDPVSAGLHGMPVDMEKTYFSGPVKKRDAELFMIDALYRMDLWRELNPGRPVSDLARPAIGNPYGLSVEGTFLTPGAEYQQHYARKTLEKCAGDCTIVELGGGYGGYAYFVSVLGGEGVRYVDIDLPEVLALASYYLMTAFPDKRFVLYGEEETPGEFPQEFDFLLWPNFNIGQLPDRSADVIFNSYSLAEMSPEAIRTYVEHFGRISRGHLIHVNHVSHAVLGADAFNIEGAGFERLTRSKALWNMGRNLDMDEFEFVFRRQTDPASGPGATS